ncbi:hypothetical protein [Leptothoe kymatousa]|uniref:Uncharacterized protein n=1 Tax=Leptothoe kymatousa TAU-MAC 1615 TaxID=2364775 RepID=A0ABS5Y6D8_9CYAN|nr:hypothetical protein [Leptothoe kymatousa]MBT9313063.1 hypothetical protein [Leptothoe kymatousa TAU-MAC 1615]
MTSQKDQIQRLIAEIEATLAKPASRLSLGLSGEADRQRQLLSKLSDYLQSLDQELESPGGWGPLDPGTGQLVSPQPSNSAAKTEQEASQVLQELMLEMRYLRENSLRPMRQELEVLQQKRESLQAELNVLEAQQRGNSVVPLHSEEQLTAFLETLMQRLQEQLSTQMVQNIATMEAAAVEQLSTSENPAPLLSGQRLEQVRLLQAQSDHLLLKLDATLAAVFDSLQKSVDSYRDSLEEGLSQMHGLGRQGEVIFHAFVNHLAQQLGQDASSYLAGDLASEQKNVAQEPIPGGVEVDLDPIQLDELDQALENLALEEEIGAPTTQPAIGIDPDLMLDDEAPQGDGEVAPGQTGDDLAVDPDLALLDDDLILDGDLNFEEDAPGLEMGIQSLEALEDGAVQSGDLPGPLETAIADASASGANDDDLSADKIPLFDDQEAALASQSDASLNLDAGLGDMDESLGLLALGADSATESTLSDEALESIVLSPESDDGELFTFNTGFDLSESSVDLSESEADGPEADGPEIASPEIASPEIASPELDGPAADGPAAAAPEQPNASPLSEDLLAFSFADDDVALEETNLELAEPLTDTELLDASQVAEDWLFDQSDDAQNDAVGDGTAPDPALVAEDLDDGGDPELEPTVENLFGDSIAAPLDSDATPVDQPDTVVSLEEILPETPLGTVDVSENVPDDVYIPASADEDLINLVETDTEQRLLIELADKQLVEQLDEDLQKLASDSLDSDYGVDDDDALEPIDQNTLETIVRDLEIEDVGLIDSSEGEDADEGPFEQGLVEQGLVDADPAAQDLVVDALPETPLVEDQSDRDLFGSFTTDALAVDADALAVSSDGDQEARVDLPEFDQTFDSFGDDGDSLDDAIPDSLADELADLSQQSNALSEQIDDTDIQLLSDLEEPVVALDELATEVPTVENAAPHLDSASTPDVPLDGEGADGEDLDSSEFLQAEQQAFWQTLANGDSGADGANLTAEATDVAPLAELSLGVDPLAATSEATSDAEPDFDDLLVLDDLDVSSEEPSSEGNLDLGDLDDLFGQSTLPDLEELDQDSLDMAPTEPADPLTVLGLDTSSSTEMRLPQVDAPDAFVDRDVETLADVPSADVDLIPESTADVSLASSVPPVKTALPVVDIEGAWFLGLDVGSTGLSAVLMNRRTGQVYPLYWQMDSSEAKHFRLPAMAVVTAAQETVAVGHDALGDLEDLMDAFGPKMADLIGVNRLKPLLKVAVGHGQTLPNSDPWLRWSDTVELPMLQVLQSMVALLKSVVDRGQAVGLDGDNLAQVWTKLQGVIVGYPTNWPDTYSFNLREAILMAGIITQPEQIVFVEDSIATVLSGLPDPNEVSVAETVSLSRQPSLYNCQWQDGTVVISAGATMTELGLVHVPKDLSSLNYGDFALRSFAYAGDALDQDIICQLLLPAERSQPLGADDVATTSWDWQGHLSSEDGDWSQLRLNDLTLPAVGHVDWAQRYRLQHRLLTSNLGQSLLAVARHLKLVLQQKSQARITLAGQQWLIKRSHLEQLVFLPYIHRINRYLNVLLSQHTVDAQAIKQVVCTGGSASLPAIARLLRSKFPNATIIQDTYAAELPQSCSRVAYGLVNIARYPHVFNITRQQYSDYFLLMELLRVFPQQPLPVGAIMHLLEQRGINTQACHLHILALLEGHLPPGLVPTTADRGLICDRTTDLPTYRALLQTPLFSKTVTESGGQIYIPNEAQAEQLRAYCNRLLLHKAQTLEEPLIAHLEVAV